MRTELLPEDNLKLKVRIRRIAAASIYVGLLYAMSFQMGGGDGEFWFALFFFPLLSGVALQVIIDPKIEMDAGRVFGLAFTILGVLTFFLIAIGYETLICLVIAFPLLIFMPWVGITMARAIIRPLALGDTSKIQLPVLATCLALTFFMPSLSLTESYKQVENQIWINASPDQVWAEIVKFPEVARDEMPWTISHDLLDAPRPVSSELVNGIRVAHWSKDVTYREIITAQRPAASLEWDFDFGEDFVMAGLVDRINPNSNQLKLIDGSYTLEQSAGGTKLILITNYRVRTPVNFYVGFWGRRFLSDNHNSIHHILKNRAEAHL